MDDNDQEQPLPQPEVSRKTKRALRKELEEREQSKPVLPDPEGSHKKFMAIMVGLFLLALALMIIFNNFMDFSVDGGI